MKQIIFSLLMVLSISVFGQSSIINDRIKVLPPPSTYTFPAVIYRSSPAAGLPLIIYCHGTGCAGVNDGTQISLMYKEGLPALLQGGYKPKGTDGKIYDFVMIAPQHNSYSPTADQVSVVIREAYLRFAIDTNRVYLTGVSAGGRGCYGPILQLGVNIAKLVAAIMPFSPATQDASIGAVWSNWSAAKVPCLAVAGTNDISYYEQAKRFNDSINKFSPGSGQFMPAFGYDHSDALWRRLYDGTLTTVDAGKNVWDWLFAQKRGSSVIVPPPPPPPPTILKTEIKLYPNAANSDSGTYKIRVVQ